METKWSQGLCEQTVWKNQSPRFSEKPGPKGQRAVRKISNINFWPPYSWIPICIHMYICRHIKHLSLKDYFQNFKCSITHRVVFPIISIILPLTVSFMSEHLLVPKTIITQMSTIQLWTTYTRLVTNTAGGILFWRMILLLLFHTVKVNLKWLNQSSLQEDCTTPKRI